MGKDGVARLRRGRVLVIGCGALGSLCAMQLAASGIGRVGIADFDTIDATNLQRQLFFSEETVGAPKAETLAARMMALNSECEVEVIPKLITGKTAESIFPQYDFIIDGSDNPATKIMTSETCERLGVAYCIGGVAELRGQAMSWTPGHAGYRDIFGDVAACSGLTPCSIAGVLGPAAGVVASVQAAEAIKYLSGIGRLLIDSLFLLDLQEPSSCVMSL